jgi:hypothetical protein
MFEYFSTSPHWMMQFSSGKAIRFLAMTRVRSVVGFCVMNGNTSNPHLKLRIQFGFWKEAFLVC